MIRSHSAKLSGLIAAASLLATPILHASAQERLPFRGNGPEGEHFAGARYVKPGALLLASFDADHDLEITPTEIETGARIAFAVADEDGNGYLTPIEQRNWAARLTSHDDILGNPSLFAPVTPGMVLEDEFVRGLEIFAQRFENSEGEILFSALTFEPDQGRRDDNRPDDDLERLRRPTITERPQSTPYR